MQWLQLIDSRFSTYPTTVRRSWQTVQKRIAIKVDLDEVRQLSQLQLAKEERDKRLKEEELQRMLARGTLQRPTDEEDMVISEDLPDEGVEEEIYQSRLKKLTSERNLHAFTSLSLEERDVLAYNKGADLFY